MSKISPDQTPDYPTQALQRFNPFEAELKQAAADYASLAIAGIDDSSGYDAVRNAIARFTGLRTGIEKTRVEIKAPALEFGRKVDKEAKRLTDLISGAESALRKEKARIDEIREDERRAAERAEMERYKLRTDQLFEAGFVYDGADYIAGNIAIWADGLLKLTDEQFAECLETGRNEAAIEKARQQKAAEQLVKDAQARQLADNQREAESAQQDAETEQRTPRLTGGEPYPVFEPVAIVSAPENVDRFAAGFSLAVVQILKILESPEKFTRAELRAKIQSLKP
jgi:hypothetical protein